MKYMYYFSINYCSFTTLDHTLSSAIETIASDCKIIILIFSFFTEKSQEITIQKQHRLKDIKLQL